MIEGTSRGQIIFSTHSIQWKLHLIPIHPHPFIFHIPTDRQVTNRETREISVLLCCSISCPASPPVPLLCVCVCTHACVTGDGSGGNPLKCVEVGGIWSRFSFKPSEKSFCNQGDTISGDREKGQRIHVAKETRRSWHSYINFHLYQARKRKHSKLCTDTLVTNWNQHFFTIHFMLFTTKSQTAYKTSNIPAHNREKKKKKSTAAKEPV